MQEIVKISRKEIYLGDLKILAKSKKGLLLSSIFMKIFSFGPTYYLITDFNKDISLGNLPVFYKPSFSLVVLYTTARVE